MKIHACYKTLGLRPDASEEEAKHAYRKLVNRWHPDRFARDDALVRLAEEHLKLFNRAYAEVKKHQAARPRRRPARPGGASRSGLQAAVSPGVRPRRPAKTAGAPAVLNRLTRKFRQILSSWADPPQKPARAGKHPPPPNPAAGTRDLKERGPGTNFDAIFSEVAGPDAARLKKAAARKKRGRRNRAVSREGGSPAPQPASQKKRTHGPAWVTPVSRIKRVGRIRRI